MKISSIILENFRSYYGRHEIRLSADDQKPITILIGSNGAGKTTLLNAVYWAFTGRFKAKFAQTSGVVHKDAYMEGKREATVELFIENGSERYHLTRIFRTSDSLLSMARINDHGEYQPMAELFAKRLLEQLMPERLASWFIFEGEKIDHMELKGDEKLKREIQETFGFGTMTTLIGHIEEIRKNLAREERKAIANNDVTELGIQIDAVEEQIKINRATITNLKAQLTQFRAESAAASEALLRFAPSQKLQKEVTLFKQSLETTEAKFKAATRERGKYVAHNSLPKLLEQELSQLINKLTVKEDEQQLPAPFGTRLIEEIQQMGKCICGTSIHPDSPEMHHLDEMMRKASTPKIGAKIFVVRARLREDELKAKAFNKQLEIKSGDIGRYDQERNHYKEIIKAGNKEIENIDEDAIKDLKRKEQTADKNIEFANRDIGHAENKLATANEHLSKLLSEYNTKVSQATKKSTLTKDRKKVERVEEFLRIKFYEQEREVLKILEGEISNVMLQRMTKHYSATISATDYSVKVVDIDSRSMEISEGEEIFVKFATIGAIVGMAGNRTKVGKVNWLTEPVIAPLMLDAPFSKVDDKYRADIAKNLSDLSGQLIMTFDQSKLDEGLYSVLEKRIGKIYTLVSHAKGNAKEAEKVFEIRGKRVLLNEYGERDETRVKEFIL
jgi:DNA sulfur modification protein DndD